MRVVTMGQQSTEITQGQTPAGTSRPTAAPAAPAAVVAPPETARPEARPVITGEKPQASAQLTKVKIKEKPARRRGFFARLFGG